MRTKLFPVLLALLMILSGAQVTWAGSIAAPPNYQRTVKTGGPIEAKYMANGPYSVEKKEEPLLQEFKKFTIYYPEELKTANKKYPVIVLCNGSGTPLSHYPAVARHYASWGFIVIGTEENYSWNGFGAEMSIRYLERMNSNQQVGDKDSLFYGKVDFDNVGVVGHSQGGAGVINTVTNTEHKDIYKTAVALSPANKELSHNLMWDYDATKVNIPIFLISGAGGGDDWVITGDQLKDIYQDIPSDKVMMRRKDTVHNEMLYSANGYVTAWFMWMLQGDSQAAKAFTGSSPEILNNDLYQDHQISLK